MADASVKRKVGFLTSGGDSQGMNAAIRAVVRMALYRQLEPYGIYDGYEGLVQDDPTTHIKPFHWNEVTQILCMGGTLIGSARCKAFRERDGRLKACHNLVRMGIDSLVVIGGDGSLTGAETLRAEWKGLLSELHRSGKISEQERDRHQVLHIVGLVGSIDNDLAGTELTIGALSALHRIVEAVDSLTTSATSHKRAFILQVMGRHCGWLALMACIAVGADWVFLPESPPEPNWPDRLAAWIRLNRQQRGKRCTLIILSEGAVEATTGETIHPEQIQAVLKEKLQLESRITVLGHVQRGGSPCAHDRILATLQGVHAIQALVCSHDRVSKGQASEGCSLVMGFQDNRICTLPLTESVALTHKVEALMNEHRYLDALQLRDRDFRETYTILHALNLYGRQPQLDAEDDDSIRSMTPIGPVSPTGGKRSLRIGMVHVGAPAGGMNAAVFAFVRYCLHHGHQPVGIYGGWTGLENLEDVQSVKDLSWMDVDGVIGHGGSILGTSRQVPESKSHWQHVVRKLKDDYALDGLVLMGGFEAFRSLIELNEVALGKALALPVYMIPATISNNVPGTEYSIGSDTALNAIMRNGDLIRTSASSSAFKKRVFIMDVQGGRCGYLATFAGLATGATYSYIPEEGITLSTVQRDIAHLTSRFTVPDQPRLLSSLCERDGKLLIRNEHASDVYTAKVLEDIMNQESNAVFDVRTCQLGHLCQGGESSPLDRIRASRLAAIAVDTITAFHDNSPDASPVPVKLIGWKDGEVILQGVQELLPLLDMKRRTVRDPWWIKYRPLINVLARYHVDEETLQSCTDIPQGYLQSTDI